MFKEWIKAAGIRAIKTVAQTAIATIGTSAVMGDVNWIAVRKCQLVSWYFKFIDKRSRLARIKEGGKINEYYRNKFRF